MENQNAEFRKAMFLVPFGAYETVQSEIISQCKITKQVFSNWLCGRSAIPELAKPIIEEILAKKIF